MKDYTKLNSGDLLMCNQGTTPGTFTSFNKSGVGSATECQAFLNISMFGMCRSPANPMVAGATAANMGAVTPAQCVPHIAGAWVGYVDEKGQVDGGANCVCQWGGIIKKVAGTV